MNDLTTALSDLDVVKKFKRLETLVDKNNEYPNKMKELFDLQKQIVNSKHLDLEENFLLLTNKYNKLKENLESDVLISLYLNTLEEVSEILNIITNIISKKIEEELL